MGYLNWINKIYLTPRDIIDIFYDRFYKKEVERQNESFEKRKSQLKFIIDEDGNVSLNPTRLEEILQKNIDAMSKIREQEINPVSERLEKSLNIINTIYANSSDNNRSDINAKLQDIIDKSKLKS